MAVGHDKPLAAGGLRVRLGLSVKLLASFVAFFALTGYSMSAIATRELERTLLTDFQARGDAVATSLSATAERSVGGDPLLLFNAVTESQSLRGLKYIFVQDGAGRVLASTFPEGPPPELLAKAQYAHDPALPDTKRIQRQTLSIRLGRSTARVMDISMPVRIIDVNVRWGGGQPGAVHVAMDLDEVDAEVASLKLKMATVGTVVALGGIVASLLVLAWTVIRPVRELTQVTSAIMIHGDLTQTIRARADDEIGDLAKTFGLMVARLRNISHAIWTSTALLENLVRELQQSADSQGRTATDQAEALRATQRAAQRIGSASSIAAQRAEVVLKDASRAEELGKTGEEAVRRSLEALTAIREQVREIAVRISSLSTTTAQVGNIAGTVKDLADQSNLLALNAAIEAVRSGEHGKGFRVVAKEMRSLADQSIHSTKRVRELLDETSAATRQAIVITEAGAQRIDAGLAQVRTSGEHLADISGIIRESSAAVREISDAVGTQNAGIVKIAEAIDQQTKMMDQTIGRLRATETSVGTLKGVAEQLVALVQEFRV